MKRGFGLITAIIIVVAVSIVGVIMIERSNDSVQKTSDTILRTQAELLSESAIEFALLRIRGFDRSSGNCLESLDINASIFDINMTMWYIFDEYAPTNCNNVLNFTTKPATTNIEDDANGTVIIDVMVRAKQGIFFDTNETIILHKRSTQQP